MLKTNKQIAMRVSKTTMAGNILLSAFKLFAGFYAHSAAMVSDAVHSLSDVAADIVVMIGVGMSHQKADREHPYGHERLECVAAIILSFLLFSVGLLIGRGGLERILGGETLPVPGHLALVAAVTSIAVKELMFWYTRHAAMQTGSVALKAAAWHHRSDALSSVGSFAGILGARLGYPILDALACVVICVFILKVAVDIFRDAIGKMTDKSCDEATMAALRRVILDVPQVLAIDRLGTRLFGDRIYVDVEIRVDGDVPLREAHDAAEGVHSAIEAAFPRVKHCMVHVNPSPADGRL